MTNEKIFANEILSEEQLDNISGGTTAEFDKIWDALEKKAGTLGDIDNGLRTVLDHLPGGKIGTAAWRNVTAPLAEVALKKCYGIDSNISIGWVGTGFRESGNTYSKNGSAMSHQQVLDTINAA